MFEGQPFQAGPQVRMVELAMYLGVGYGALADSPRWFLEILAIRRAEEAEYNAAEARKAEQKQNG